MYARNTVPLEDTNKLCPYRYIVDVLSYFCIRKGITLKVLCYGYIKSHPNNIIVHPYFNRKRRWTKETNCGDANKWLVRLRLV